MTTVYVLKEYATPDCNSSLILGVYQNYADAILERDRLRAKYPRRIESLWYGIYSPRALIDVVEYPLIEKNQHKECQTEATE